MTDYAKLAEEFARLLDLWQNTKGHAAIEWRMDQRAEVSRFALQNAPAILAALRSHEALVMALQECLPLVVSDEPPEDLTKLLGLADRARAALALASVKQPETPPCPRS